MILDRLDRAFDQVDIAYTEMYERHIKFEEYPSNENKQKLLKATELFKTKYFYYLSVIKSIYISDKKDIIFERKKLNERNNRHK